MNDRPMIKTPWRNGRAAARAYAEAVHAHNAGRDFAKENPKRPPCPYTVLRSVRLWEDGFKFELRDIETERRAQFRKEADARRAARDAPLWFGDEPPLDRGPSPV